MKRFYACLLFLLGSFCLPAQAGVVMLGTRVIYPADNTFVQVKFDNKDAKLHLMQVWVDEGQGSPQFEGKDIPFVVTPPIFKIKEKSQQTVRVILTKNAALPADRESLYWFNFLQIPPESKDKNNSSSINLAFLNQVKLIYRPEHIVGKVETLPQDINFSLKRRNGGWQLTATNPTGYYATFTNEAQITSAGQSSSISLQPEVTLAPFSTLSWNIKLKDQSLNNPKISYKLINDKGAAVAATKEIAY